MQYSLQQTEKLVQLFKTMGDTTRLKILLTLGEGERSVGDIVSVLDMSVSAVSHQLKVLKLTKLVKSRRDGKQQLYSLDDEHIKKIIEVSMHHVDE